MYHTYAFSFFRFSKRSPVGIPQVISHTVWIMGVQPWYFIKNIRFSTVLFSWRKKNPVLLCIIIHFSSSFSNVNLFPNYHFLSFLYYSLNYLLTLPFFFFVTDHQKKMHIPFTIRKACGWTYDNYYLTSLLTFLC